MAGSEYHVKIIIDSKDNTSVAAGKATKSLGNLKSAAKLAAGAFIALKGAQKAVDFVKLGASIQATEDRFYKFVGSGSDADKMLRALGDASDHTMTRIGKLDTASQLFSLGLATTGDEMAIAGGMIGKLGKATLSTEGRMNSLTMLLANRSTRRLDDFSLSVEEVTARQKELEGQGISTQQAFKTAVYDIAAKKIATLGDTSQLAATKISQIERGLTDTKNALAEMAVALLDASGALDKTTTWATGVADVTNAVRESGFSIQAWVKGMDAYVAGGKDGAAAAAAFTQEQERQNAAFDEAIPKYSSYHLNQERIAASANEAKTAITGYTGYVVNGTIAIDDQTVALEENAAALEIAQAAAEAATIKQSNLAMAFMEGTKADIAKRAIGELGDLLDSDKITIDQYKQAVTETQLAFGLADKESIWLADSVLSLTERLGAGQVKASEFDDELANMIERAGLSRAGIVELGNAIDALPSSKTVDVYVKTHNSGAGSGSTWGLEASRAKSEAPYARRQHGGLASGMAMVGERGPEMVQLSPGSRVYNRQQSTNIANNYNMTVNTQATSPSVQQDYHMMQARIGA